MVRTAFLLLLVGCGDDAATDAAVDARTPDSGSADAAIARDSGFDAGMETDPDAGPADPPFEPAGFPETVPFGPSFAGLQNDERDGTPDDTALAIFWQEDAVAVDYTDETCMATRTLRTEPRGRDVGALTAIGGSGVERQLLTFQDEAFVYFLDGDVDPWSPGDALSIEAEGIAAGPAIVPDAFASTTLASVEAVVRGRELTIEITGGDTAGISISGAGIAQDYQLLCVGPVEDGTFAIPAAALATIPATVTEVNVKLQPAAIAQGDGVAVLAAGVSSSITVPVRDP
jgi:hypothetical protein